MNISFSLHQDLYNWLKNDILMIDSSNIAKFYMFKNIQNLEEGQCFGELALKSSKIIKKRAARIECLQTCTFCTL
jgi:hypothetical protein